MTEYKKVEGTQEQRPLEIDSASSPNVVYQRIGIKKVAKQGNTEDSAYTPEHWEYEEREMSREEYAQYLISMEQAKLINEHSDEEAIDNYTRQLMDEGVL